MPSSTTKKTPVVSPRISRGTGRGSRCERGPVFASCGPARGACGGRRGSPRQQKRKPVRARHLPLLLRRAM